MRLSGEGWRTGALVFVAGTASVVGYFAPLGYAALAALGGLMLAPVTLRPSAPPPAWSALGLLAAWATVSMAWSPIRAELSAGGYADLEAITAAKLWLQLALYGLLAVGAMRVGPAGAGRVARVLAVCVAVWCVFALADGLTRGGLWNALAGVVGLAEARGDIALRKAAAGTYPLAVLVWPAAAWLALRGRRELAIGMVAALAIGAALMGAFASVAAVLAGGAVLVLVRSAGGRGVWMLGIGMALLLVLTPALVAVAAQAGWFSLVEDDITRSWAERLRIWSLTADLIAADPLRGHGLDASRTFGIDLPLHPHSASLQLWLELGVFGALIAALVWLLLTARMAKLAVFSRDAAAVAAAAAAAYFTIGALSFGIWQEWWLATAALAVAACTTVAIVTIADEAEADGFALERA